MAANTIEVLLRFTGDPRNAKEAIAQVRADLMKSGQEQVNSARNVNKQVAAEAKGQTKTLEAEERQRTRTAESLQRQRSAALIVAWKTEARERARIQKETEQANAKAGQLFNLDSLLGNVPALRGVTSQFSALSTEAAGATTAIAGVAGAIGIFVAGAAVAVGVMVKLGSEIFDLTKKTAAFQGKFFDLSQQVGVSVETLSTLDVIASTTGGNIDTVTGSLALFQRNLEDAHDPTSKEAKLLGELGVTSLDTEVALRQTLKGLFALGETAEQTDKTLLLFGRSGRFVNAILKESKGDIDAAAKAFGGLQITREAAAAADAFNDSLEILNRTLARVGANIVGTSIPVFTVFFQEMNQGLTGNADDWSFWASVVEAEVAGVLGTLEGFILFVRSGFNIDLGIAIDTSIRSLLDRAEKLRNKTKFESDIDRIQRITAGILAGSPGDRPKSDADKANSEAQARAAKSITLQQRALEESTRVHRETLERERDRDLKNIEEWEDESILALADHVLAQGRLYEQELANARRFIKNSEDLRLAETDITLRRAKTNADAVAAIDKVKDEAQKRRDQAELTLNQQLLKTRDAQRESELQKIKADLDQRTVAESGAILRRMALLKQAHEDRMLLIDIELGQNNSVLAQQEEINRLTAELNSNVRGLVEAGNIDIINRPQVENLDKTVSTVRSISVEIENLGEVLIPTVSETGKLLTDLEAIEEFKRTGKHLGIFADSESASKFAEKLHEQQARIVEIRKADTDNAQVSAARQIELTNQKIESEIKYTTEFRRLTQERIAAMLEEGRAATPRPGGPVPTELPKIIFDDSVLGEVPEALSEWEIAIESAKEAWRSLEEQMQSFGAFAGGLVIPAIEGIAGAVADSVVAWALYGKSFGEAMKQGLAAVAARVAGEAAFQGALHAAYAIGSLAFGDFSGAAQHALAAAKFFAIAAITGVAARAIAGNSFQRESSSGASAGSGSSGRGSAPITSQPKPQEFDRNARNQQAIVRELTFKVKGDAVIDKWVEDFSLNGRTRITIMSEQ